MPRPVVAYGYSRMSDPKADPGSAAWLTKAEVLPKSEERMRRSARAKEAWCHRKAALRKTAEESAS